MNTLEKLIEWNSFKKIIIRFMFLYFIIYLYSIPFPLFFLPLPSWFYEIFIYKIWDILVPWVSNHILFIPEETIRTFSKGGDTIFQYIMLLITFSSACILTLIWTLLDKSHTEYKCLWVILLKILRYYLGFTMLVYGTSKLLKVQFPDSDLITLISPLGMLSPMDMLWNFMGYSYPYDIFTGVLQIISGLMFFFYNTSLFAGLLCFLLMSNIVALNLCYDVPVKLYSIHLLLISIILLFDERTKILLSTFRDIFVFKRNHIKGLNPKFIVLIKIAAIALFIFFDVSDTLSFKNRSGSGRQLHPLHGVYDIISFSKNKDSIPPLITENSRWRQLIIEWEGKAHIRMMNDSIKEFTMKTDTITKKINFQQVFDSTVFFNLNYSYEGIDEIRLSGTTAKGSLIVEMKKIDLKFPLTTHQFNWIDK